MSDSALEMYKQLIADALKHVRDGRLLELSVSALAHTELVEESLLAGIPISADVRGRALQALLLWATNKLRPSGEPGWTAYAWRLYNTVYHFYFDGMRVADLAERMAIAEQTLYQARSEALVAIARIWLAEMDDPQDLAGRKSFVISDRYAFYSAEQRLIMRVLAAFQLAMPLRLLHRLAEQAGSTNVTQNVAQLVASHLVVTNERGTELLLNPEVAHYLLTRLTPDERSSWHRAIGDYFLDRRDYQRAAAHYCDADMDERAAQVLIDHYEPIINDLQVEEMMSLIGRLHPSAMSEQTWVRLKIVAGDAAMLLEDVDSAIDEYRQALAANEVEIKALAYFRRARALKLKYLDEAIAHYGYSIRLLETQAPGNPLLVRVYIDRAFLFLEERDDVLRADIDLKRAAELISPNARLEWMELHTAWLRLCSLRGEWDQAIEHGLQAWLAANETNQAGALIKAAHNLGMTYARLGRFDDALGYLERSRELAQGVGDRHMEALNGKTIGNGLFMVGRVEAAVPYYLEAQRIFSELGNRNWQAHTCYDLAEAYAELGDIVQLQKYFEDGLRLADESGDVRLLEEFQRFGRRHDAQLTALNSRQIAALDFVQARGQITNREYQDLCDVSARQALRDLLELEEAGLLLKTGKGRGTHYRLKQP